MDRARIEAFLDRFLGYASGATTIGLLSVADQSGLLSWLGEHQSGTSSEIAAGAGLNPRYVTEILSGLAAAGVLEYEPDEGLFRLPPEHSLFLADEASPYFMGGWLDMIPTVMRHLGGVAEATVHGGGVSFDEFGDEFIRGLDRGNGPSQRVFLTDRWLPAVPGLIDRMESGIRVADVGCGTGTAAMVMAARFPASQIFGYDTSEVSLEVARGRIGALTNVRFDRHSASGFPIDPPYQLVTTFDVIHDLTDPQAALGRIRMALSEDGVYLMMEPNASSHVENNLDDRGALLYGISTLHCMTQSLAEGGEGLGSAWGREKAEEYAARAGFSSFQPLEEITNRFSSFYLLGP